MQRVLAGLAICLCLLSARGFAQTKCEASVNGFKIHNVFIVGDQANGVAWAYKNISDWTCLTPTTDLSKADAILEVHGIGTHSGGAAAPPGPLTVTCSSRGASSSCLDSEGNELTVDCRGGTCNSYYGPSLSSAVGGALHEWITTRWYESGSRLWTVDHKLLWQEENQKHGFMDQWPDILRLGTNSPPCKPFRGGSMDRHRYQTYREYGAVRCGIEFAPETKIDLVLNGKEERKAADAAAKAEMVNNAHEAAAAQQAAATKSQE